MKNTLRMYRRHVKGCAFTKPTFQPQTKREQMADTCQCPIVAQGYLAQHLTPQGKQKRILHNALDGATVWSDAAIVVAELLKAEKLTEEPVKVKTAGPVDASILAAIVRFEQSRGVGSLNPVEHTTKRKYEVVLRTRLLPWCEVQGITSMKEFEVKDTCQRFVESWRMLVRNVGAELSQDGKKSGLNLFKAFLNFSVEAGFLTKNGAKGLNVTQDKNVKRHGLELDEYKRILQALDGTDLAANETRAAMELMRYTGMRISDAAKFNRAELVPNVSGNGFNADFIQKKTGKRCIVPVPGHVVALLNALPVRESGNYFSVSRFVIADRIQAIFDGVKTKHKVTPHCLRHTFAIQLITAGVDISIISKWMGHESVSITQKHYQNVIDSTKVEFERIARESVERMLERSSAA